MRLAIRASGPLSVSLPITAWSALTPWALSVVRIVVGLLFLEHGTSKYLGFPAEHRPLEPLSMSGAGGLLELFGGALIVLGLFTRPVAFLLSGEMAVAYFYAHFPRNFFPVINGGDAAILYCFVFLYLIFAGGGPWSLDALLARGRSQTPSVV
jgi:putative oxidoreductase